MQNSALHKAIKFGTLTTDLLYIFIKDRRNALKLYKMLKELKFEGDWTKL